MTLIGSFIAFVLTFAVFSFLWRDNPLYRTVENIFLGVALGLFASFEIRQVLLPRIYDRLAAGSATGGAWIATICIVLVTSILAARAIAPLAWLGRVPVAIAVGSLAGMAAAGFARVVLLPQVAASAASLTITSESLRARSVCLLEAESASALTNLACRWGGYLNALFIFAAVIAGLLAVAFARKENKTLRGVSRFGTLIIMITLGVTLGYLAMTHFAVTIGRAQTMMESPGLAGLALLVVAILVAVTAQRRTPVTR